MSLGFEVNQYIYILFEFAVQSKKTPKVHTRKFLEILMLLIDIMMEELKPGVPGNHDIEKQTEMIT